MIESKKAARVALWGKAQPGSTQVPGVREGTRPFYRQLIGRSNGSWPR